MEALGAVIGNLLSRPRLAWLATALASGAFIHLRPLERADRASSVAEISNAVAWALLLISCAVFALTICSDLWHFAVRELKVRNARRSETSAFLALSGPTRALLVGLVVNDQNSIWLPEKFGSVVEITVHQLGVISERVPEIIHFRFHSSKLEWARKMVLEIGDGCVDEPSKAKVFEAVKEAQEKLRSGGFSF